MNKEQVRSQFGAAAASYATSKVHAQGASLARLVQLTQPQPAWRVLDVATGAGHTAFAFAPHVAQVIATDITPEMLGETVLGAEKRGLHNVTTQSADAEELPFAAASFQLVTCRIAPHHFPDVPAFLRACGRVLQPGGLLAVVDNIVPDDPQAAAYVNQIEKLRDPSHARCLSLSEWLVAFAAAGFVVEHHEVAPKAIAFNEWAGRMVSDPATLAQLQRLLRDAPLAAAEFLQLQQAADDLLFTLSEALVIGRSLNK
jgi:ubiquinone/menaquinone biosynthesis C-methylase UbiE